MKLELDQSPYVVEVHFAKPGVRINDSAQASGTTVETTSTKDFSLARLVNVIF